MVGSEVTTPEESTVSLLNELLRTRRLMVRCPDCQDDFPIQDAQLFDARRPLDGSALKKLEEERAAVAERRAELKQRMTTGIERSRIGGKAINLGKVVEKVAPSLSGFPLQPGDCRALFEPIDYITFDGLSRTGRVESVHFVDVKSGKARLSERKRKNKPGNRLAG